MTPVEKQSAKVRDLVEGAGFVLAMSLNQAGMFRILANDSKATVVAQVAVTSKGFRAFFPAKQVQASTPTDLVNALEAIPAAS